MGASALYFRFLQEIRGNPLGLSGLPCRFAVDVTSTDDAFEAGYDAYWDGDRAEDNPFKPETPDWRAWKEGWSQAANEDEDGQQE